MDDNIDEIDDNINELAELKSDFNKAVTKITEIISIVNQQRELLYDQKEEMKTLKKEIIKLNEIIKLHIRESPKSDTQQIRETPRETPRDTSKDISKDTPRDVSRDTPRETSKESSINDASVFLPMQTTITPAYKKTITAKNAPQRVKYLSLDSAITVNIVEPKIEDIEPELPQKNKKKSMTKRILK
jgi:hypothetical protein